MKNLLIVLVISIASANLSFGQILLDSTINSSTKKILLTDPNLFAIGSYGEAHYNQEIIENTFQNGNMDLHRVILFMGYKFNNNIQFFSEIEFEHVQEVYVEQAFMNYRFNNAFNLKAGIILIPMGVVNEFHEPTLFNGVERSDIDKYILPTTWREMGIGSHGILKKANLQYQLYMVNGFKGYNGSALVSGKNGLRSARQKGAEATFRTPSFTGKLTYYGINGLNLGVSGYYGQTESTLYDGLGRDDQEGIAMADSSAVGIAMASINATYTIKNLSIKILAATTQLSNTEEYNEFTGTNAATRMFGYYGELGYNFKLKSNQDFPLLIPFVRYENFDTHAELNNGATRNTGYHKEVLTTGLGLQLTPGVIFKSDFQWRKTEADPKPTNMLNVGFGYWF